MGRGKDKSRQAETSKAEPPATEPAIPKPTPTPPNNPATPEANNPNPLSTPPDLSPLGVNEEKKAPPNKNPLEGGKDNFLEGLE